MANMTCQDYRNNHLLTRLADEAVEAAFPTLTEGFDDPYGGWKIWYCSLQGPRFLVLLATDWEAARRAVREEWRRSGEDMGFDGMVLKLGMSWGSSNYVSHLSESDRFLDLIPPPRERPAEVCDGENAVPGGGFERIELCLRPRR